MTEISKSGAKNNGKNRIFNDFNVPISTSLINIEASVSKIPTLNLGMYGASSVLGEIANALTIGMPNGKIFNDYRGILDTQKIILKSADEVYKKFAIPASSELKLVTDRINSILSPVSGAIVDLGLGMANATKLYEAGNLKAGAFADLQKVSSISFDAIKGQQGLLLSSLEIAKKNSEHLIMDRFSPFTSMMVTGLDATTRAIPTFPSETKFPTLEIVRKETFLNDEEISEAQKILDGMFEKIGHAELIEIRKGCWDAFRTKKRDYIRQASSSMRGLVDTLFRELAPRQKVVDTEYFKNDPEGKSEKGQPTRKAKMYYLVNYDQKKAEHLKRMAKALDEFHQNLSAWDHEPIKNSQFVYGSLIAIEACIIQLLSEIREEV